MRGDPGERRRGRVRRRVDTTAPESAERLSLVRPTARKREARSQREFIARLTHRSFDPTYRDPAPPLPRQAGRRGRRAAQEGAAADAPAHPAVRARAHGRGRQVALARRARRHREEFRRVARRDGEAARDARRAPRRRGRGEDGQDAGERAALHARLQPAAHGRRRRQGAEPRGVPPRGRGVHRGRRPHAAPVAQERPRAALGGPRRHHRRRPRPGGARGEGGDPRQAGEAHAAAAGLVLRPRRQGRPRARQARRHGAPRAAQGAPQGPGPRPQRPGELRAPAPHHPLDGLEALGAQREEAPREAPAPEPLQEQDEGGQDAAVGHRRGPAARVADPHAAPERRGHPRKRRR